MTRIMHQHAGGADMVHMFDINFKVEDVNRRSSARRDAGGLNQCAVGRLQVLANSKLPGFHELLSINTPERMIVRAAKRLRSHCRPERQPRWLLRAEMSRSPDVDQTSTRLSHIDSRTGIDCRDLRQTLSTQFRQVQINLLTQHFRVAIGCGAAASG